MEEKNKGKRREWVKNAAIIFLTIMLILTFFSNTIMNYSLPEVATQQVQRGTITAKIRGTGNVEATDPYNVVAKESRVISSVAVKQGDTVEKDQIIYYLEDAESEELTKAEQELEDLELAYMKGLFGANVSSEVISKVANGNIDNFSQLQAKVTDMQNRLDAAKARVDECQKKVDEITLQSTKATNDASVSTKGDELDKDKATLDLSQAQSQFEKNKAATIASLNAQISSVQDDINDLITLIRNAESEIPAGKTAYEVIKDLQERKDGSVAKNLKDAKDELANSKKNLEDALMELNNMRGKKGESAFTDYETAIRWCESVDKTLYIEDDKKTINDYIDNYKDYIAKNQIYMAASADYKEIEDTITIISNLITNQAALESKNNQLAGLKNQLAEVQAITATSNGDVQEAQSRLDRANRNILEITTANTQTNVAWQNKLAEANAALKNAQAVYELLKAEQTELTADINAELDLAKASKDIANKEEEIAKLKEKSMGASVKAPVAGTIMSLKYVAGETTKPEEVMAVIQAEGKGFTLSISVTNEQAKKVQVGDVAELQNAWYYDDVMVTLASIRPDPDKAGTNKLLVFNVSGSTIQAGQSLSISVGQKSAEYELVVPNSAVREDNNGKFILTVESKSSPLGNRYIATRTNVEVLATDDNNTAISAPLYGYEYVITTSTKPVVAGKQVRLNE